ncbi:hypothetical protein [Mesobacterium pallidum]|uniref:hypothetical protein n=1 Tax=Mesobacterium pallidum TaxID=2872037 RepID=UPI001EE16606|nr:hypothetical protein [Mesobacterium pallidum]
MALVPLPDVVGTVLDGGGMTISEAENRALCESVGDTPAADGSAHPVWFYVASQVGMGPSVAELCAICAFDVNDGPMMASTGGHFHAPLMVGQTYLVKGEITGLTRKQSRKLGVMDLLEYKLHLDLPDGTRVCSVDNAWVLPRGRDNEA